MKVYILLHMYGGWDEKIEGVFKNEIDAQQMLDSFDPPYDSEFKLEEHEVTE